MTLSLKIKNLAANKPGLILGFVLILSTHLALGDDPYVGQVNQLMSELREKPGDCAAEGCQNIRDALKYMVSQGRAGKAVCGGGAIPRDALSGLFCDPQQTIVALPTLAKNYNRIAPSCRLFLATVAELNLEKKSTPGELSREVEELKSTAEQMGCFPMPGNTYPGAAPQAIVAAVGASKDREAYCGLFTLPVNTGDSSCPDGFNPITDERKLGGYCEKAIHTPGLETESLTLDPTCSTVLANPDLVQFIENKRAQGLSKCALAGGTLSQGLLHCGTLADNEHNGLNLSRILGFKEAIQAKSFEETKVFRDAITRELIQCQGSSATETKTATAQLAYIGKDPRRPQGASGLCDPQVDGKSKLAARYSQASGECTRQISISTSPTSGAHFTLAESCMGQVTWASSILKALENGVTCNGVPQYIRLQCDPSGVTLFQQKDHAATTTKSLQLPYSSVTSSALERFCH